MMKRYLLLFTLSVTCILLGGNTSKAQLFQQNFNSSNTVADYAHASSPTTGQFNSISSSGAGVTLSISSNQLRFARSGSNAGSFSRTTNLSGSPTSLMYRFDISVSGNSIAQTTAATFQVGSGFGTANSVQANADVHSRIGVNYTASAGQFSLRDIGGATNTGNYTGTQTVTWIINNSGSSLTYKAPDGSYETVDNDKFDLWIGTSRELNEANATTGTVALEDLKFVFSAGTATIDIDNILIDPVPGIPTSGAATSINSNDFTANWSTVPGVTGYRLDVATDAGFTSFVPGYNDYYVSGQATSSQIVTGLDASTDYYYRIRAAGQYTVGEFAGNNSSTQNLTTTTGGPSPTIITSLSSLSSFGDIVSGNNSSEATYTVSGDNLTNDVTVTAAAGFEVSTTSGSGFGLSVNLTESGGDLVGEPVTIYVRFSPSSDDGTYSGNIANTSTGASAKNVAVSGNALSTEPSTSTSSVTFGTINMNSIVVNFSGGNGSHRIVVARQASAVSYSPIDGIASTGVNSNFTSASDQGNGNKIVYDGTAATVTVNGLTEGTAYHFAVYEYNIGTGTSYNYKTTSPGIADATTSDNVVSIASLGTNHTENFNSLAHTGTSSTMPTGWFFAETGSNANSTYSTGTGNSNSGDTYSFGATDDPDRALGSLLSANLSSTFGAKITNNTGVTITSLYISYTGEQWRLGTTSRTDVLNFEYSTDASSVNDDGATWISVKELDFRTPNTASSTGASNGNAPEFRTAVEYSIPVSIANGNTIWIHWVDSNASGADDGLAIDDMSISGYSTTQANGSNISGTVDHLNVQGDATVTLDADLTINGTMNLGINSRLVLNGYTLNLNGDLNSGKGVITGSATSKLDIGGNGNLSNIILMDQVTANGNKLEDLTINRGTSAASVVTLGNALTIIGDVSLQNGTLATGGFLTLASDATGDASIGQIAATADITGDVTVERYVPAVARRYRIISPNVASFTYSQLADDIFVTGPGGNANGFENVANTLPTIYTYLEDNTGDNRGWTAPQNINHSLSGGSGALVFIRGDRSLASPDWYQGPYPPQNSVTIDFNGNINKGTISPGITYTNTSSPMDDGWNLVGNPYPSPIDWNLISRSNLTGFYYCYDPLTGSYVSDDGTNLIASGQGFFVQAFDSSPEITFEESCKTTSTPTKYFKGTTPRLSVTMKLDATNSDVAWLDFVPGAHNTYQTNEDALKFSNALINMGFYTSDAKQVQYSRVAPLTNISDTFSLFTNAANGNYTLEFSGLSSVSSNKSILLKDLFTNTISDIRINASYAFAITANPLSYENRFLVIFIDQSALPVELVSLNAFVSSKENVMVTWATSSEKNNDHFVVERMTEDTEWLSVGNVSGKGSSYNSHNYSFIDHGAAKLNVPVIYYRLKQVDKSGKTSISSVVTVYLRTEPVAQLRIFPNPASSHITIQSKESIGLVTVYDLTGKNVFDQKIETTAYQLDISPFENGIYFIEANGSRQKLTIAK